jgi:hypothetical protein
MSPNLSSDLLYDAVSKHYEAEKASAHATLQIYFNNAAGIGEHPQVVEEMVKQLEKLASAEDCLESLERNFHASKAA